MSAEILEFPDPKKRSRQEYLDNMEAIFQDMEVAAPALFQSMVTRAFRVVFKRLDEHMELQTSTTEVLEEFIKKVLATAGPKSDK